MKKRLLMQLLVAMCAVGAYAVNVGDYLYTRTAKYKVLGENLVTNGSFNVGDGLTSYADENGGTVNGDVWSIEKEQGPAGENVLNSKQAANSGDSYCVTRVWSGLEPGFYTISYWVKGGDNLVTNFRSTTARIYWFCNTTGLATLSDDARQVSGEVSLVTEWQQVVETVELAEGEYLVMNLQSLPSGTQFTDIEINKAQQVFDTRITDRLIAYVESLLAEEKLSNKEELAGALDAVKGVANDPSQNENADALEGMIGEFQDAIEQFLDANGGNLVGNGYLSSWTSIGSNNWNRLGNVGTWTFEGGRWGFSANDATRERPENDGWVATAGIQKSFNLPAGDDPEAKVGVRTLAGALPTMTAGTYMFSIEAQAVAAAYFGNAADSYMYGSDYTRPVENPQIWVGKDTVTIERALSNNYWQRFYYIAEIKEGEEVAAGFRFPKYLDQKGGRYSLRNPEFRKIGLSKEELIANYDKEQINLQQTELKKRIDEYPTELKDYLWEQDSLQRAIASATALYEASLKVVDAEGNVVDPSQVSADYTALVLAEVNALGKARAWVISCNAVIDNLKKVVDDANTSLNAEANKNADATARSQFQAAINEGQALYDGRTATNQMDEFNASITKIQDAQAVFEATTATYANPSAILLKNPNFDAWSSGNNVTASGSSNGWNFTIGTDANRWEMRAKESIKTGIVASMWRGTTVAPQGKVQQTVELRFPGIYEFRSKAYATDDTRAQFVAVADLIYDGDEVVDTVFTNSPVKLFFGLDGLPDSLRVTKGYNDNNFLYMGKNAAGADSLMHGTDGWYYCSPYAVYYVKNSPLTENVTVEFGLECIGNQAAAGVNGFGFGECQILYGGNEAQYLTDLKAALTAEVAKANAVVAATPDAAYVNFLVVKLKRYINAAATATTAAEMQNVLLSLQELESVININVDAVTVGVKGVFVSEPVSKAAQGVYSLSGVKVAADAQSLKPGLYIINGKKYVVK